MEDNKDELLNNAPEVDEEEDLQVGEVSSNVEYNHGNIDSVQLAGKLKQSFLNYAMSVIVDRALPDARDGLKPVQRRILYGMDGLKITYNVAHKKSAHIVGDVMGKYHPHGDSSIYEALVRMAQDFSYRYPLVDGHGNFGSIDGDGAAAYRYTEARMSRISAEMLRDLRKNTVDFVPNYDGTEEEPSVLPSRIPNLLANGATGIAVGLATNIPPHNLGELIDGCIAIMENEDLTSDELMQFVKGPDFPTGGIVMGLDGLREAYNSGHGTIVIRSRCEIVEPKTKKGHTEIIVSEIPYGLRKSALLERIGQVAKEHLVEGITDLRDESSMKGMRIVIELRNDVNAQVVLNNLYKYTPLQSSYGINMIALVDGAPESLSLRRALDVYIDHQLSVITRRTQFDLDEDLKRMHLLEGFIIASDNTDEVIKIIKNSKNGDEKEKLKERFNLDDIQAQAILDMQLKRLSGLNREKTEEEYHGLEVETKHLEEVLGSKELKEEILKTELLEIKQKYSDKRRSELQLHTAMSIENEDLIPEEEVMITVTEQGYAKRMNLAEYHSQNRGGIGVSSIKTKDKDHVKLFLYTSSHNFLLFFTNTGRIYKMKAYNIPESSKNGKGMPLVNLLSLKDGETIEAISSIKTIEDSDKYLFFITKKGIVKRTALSYFQNIMKSGIKAINLRDDDSLLTVLVTNGNNYITLGASNGKSITFEENEVRDMGRSASGVRGMRIADDEEIVGASVIQNKEDLILALSQNGYGKLTPATDYRLQSRGGKGVITLKTTEKNGNLVDLEAVIPTLDLILTTNKGITIRVHISSISQSGRNSQGVRIVKLREGQYITNVAIVPHEDEENNEENVEEITEE